MNMTFPVPVPVNIFLVMLFLGDVIHLTVSSALINTTGPISSTVDLQQSKASPFTFTMIQMQSGGFHMLPNVPLSGCMTPNVH
jgi:hypothetical protein